MLENSPRSEAKGAKRLHIIKVMTRIKQIQALNQILLMEMPEYRSWAVQFPEDDAAQRRLVRSLMNVRPPMPLKPEFLTAQDKLLSAEREEKGAVDGDTLPVVVAHPRLVQRKAWPHRKQRGNRKEAEISCLKNERCPAAEAI